MNIRLHFRLGKKGVEETRSFEKEVVRDFPLIAPETLFKLGESDYLLSKLEKVTGLDPEGAKAIVYLDGSQQGTVTDIFLVQEDIVGAPMAELAGTLTANGWRESKNGACEGEEKSWRDKPPF